MIIIGTYVSILNFLCIYILMVIYDIIHLYIRLLYRVNEFDNSLLRKRKEEKNKRTLKRGKAVSEVFRKSL